jgi:hypothetical protein
MFEAYRILPVLEWEGNDESRQLESFTTIELATEAQRRMLEIDPDADLDIRLFWTIYGVNAESNGMRSEEAISDVEDEAAAHALLRKLIGPFATDPKAPSGGYYVRLSNEMKSTDLPFKASDWTTADADRLLGLADQLLDDWAEDAVQGGKPDEDYERRSAEWTAIRPLLVSGPTMLRGLREILDVCQGSPDPMAMHCAALAGSAIAASDHRVPCG